MVIKQELKKSHPDINYQFISPRKMQTNHLLDTLYTVDPKTTGILFSSWFYKHTFAGNTSLVTNSHLLVSTTSAPLFSLGMMTIKDNAGGIIGGYIYDQHVYSQKTHTNDPINIEWQTSIRDTFLRAFRCRSDYQLQCFAT